MNHYLTGRTIMDKASYLATAEFGRQFADELINVRKSAYLRIGFP